MVLSSHECPREGCQQKPKEVRVGQPFRASILIWKTVRHNYACKKKRVLWHSIRSIGSAHDATAFKDSNLYQILKKRAEQLAMDQFFYW